MRIIFLLVIFCSASFTALAQTTTFTYQGRLTDGATAANGTYDLQFKLTDLSGVQVGSVISHNGVIVTNGVFTVLLNYGSSFTGADRMLEIGIKPAGSADPYTVLAPRQPITSTPYAIRAARATNADQLGGVAASEYVQTTDPRLTVNDNFIHNTVTPQVAHFNIQGNGTVSNLLKAGFVDASRYFLDGDRFMGRRDQNTYLGTAAGGALAIGSNNGTFVGDFAGSQMQGGRDNTFVGAGAGAQNNESNNSFFGRQAGGSSIGDSNSYFGRYAGRNGLSGSMNAFFGFESGLDTESSNNAFFGGKSGRSNTTGGSNSFFGESAGLANTTASDNSFFGFESGKVSTGATNSFFGSKSGLSNTSGLGSVFVGASAGGSNTSGSNNAFFGRNAGQANQTGSNNTAVGALADVDSTNLSFATAIGAGTRVAASNTIVLGRSNGSDAVQVPGTLAFSTLGTVGVVSLCRNPLNQISSCSSSLRYKKDLVPFKGGLTLLNSLKPITFTWKADNSKDLGFGAEDVAAVEPLLVTRNEAGQVEGVKYDRITAVLVNAVKEQQAQIQQQQQQIAELKRLVCARNRRSSICK